MFYRIVSVFLLISLFTVLKAQRGGETMYGLLHLTQSARMATFGGNQVGMVGNDVSMLVHNPAMMDSTWSEQISLNYVPYIADINYGFGGLAWSFSNIGNFAFGVHHLDYGSFIAAEESGVQTGTFGAGETVIQTSFSRQLSKRWSAGISLKPVVSKIESYHSWALAGDLGLFYRSTDGLFSFGAALKNCGRQLSAYDSSPLENLVPDLQFGVSKKLKHAPFRFLLTAQDLLSRSLSYNVLDNSGIAVSSEEKDSFDKKLLRHLVLGLEFVPSNNFYVGAGVNPRRRQELKVESLTSTVGYSWGFGLRVYKFNFSYGSTRYHLGATSNYFSVTTNLSSF
ncbi:MAG TPA: type IX secretion system protein PorQ [Marinilabiliaceae bacterium]|nr:type IX secretion system protein PorQ [Marinilabiliaceae bacterium]